ncbi:MAG: PAS domain S-box protein [Polyangiaceae bacterium]
MPGEESAPESAALSHALGSLLNQARTALFVLGGAGEVLTMNAAAQRLVRSTLPLAAGRKYSSLPCFTRDAGLRGALDAALVQALGGRYQHVDGVMAHECGEQRHVQLHLTPFVNALGEASGVIVEGLDITERVMARRALEESERRYRSIFETNPAIKIVLDPTTGEIVDANAAAAEFYGYELDQLKQMRILDINVASVDEIQAEMELARTSRRLFFNFRHRLASGEVRDVEVYSGPIQVAGRELLHSIIIDVTDRKRLEQRVARAERLEAIGQLAGGVAHDFNNILTVVLGYVELAQRLLPSEHPAGQCVQEIDAAARRAAELSQQLLGLSRTQVAATEPLDIGETLLGMDRFLRRLISEDIELVTVVEPQLARVEINRGRLEQAIVNLVVNARDAIAGPGRIRIEVHQAMAENGPLQAAHGSICIRVSDDGSGIAADALPYIFDPLFSTKESQGGTGFGLATTKNIVESAGGEVLVETAIGEGTTFALWLPACELTREPVPHRQSMVQRVLRGRVLLAEDEPAVRRLMVRALVGAGYEVDQSENGDTALRRFESDPAVYDALVTDVVMPLLSGPELARRVLALRPNLPVLFVSGYPADLDSKLLAEGSRSFLAKPFTASELVEQLDALIPAATTDWRAKSLR